jgi:hypothetical protein
LFLTKHINNVLLNQKLQIHLNKNSKLYQT